MRERTPLTRAIIERLPNLRLIASTGAVNAWIDLEAARERGITVAHTGYTAHGAIELTWALILAAARHVPDEVTSFRTGGWQVAVGDDLERRTLGILGLGRIGSASARIAQAFRMNVIAWSPNLTREKAEAAGVRFVSKDDLFREADILTVHMVLGKRSRGIVGAGELALMKPAAWLVNTSRGPLVDEAALIDALRSQAHRRRGARRVRRRAVVGRSSVPLAAQRGCDLARRVRHARNLRNLLRRYGAKYRRVVRDLAARPGLLPPR